MVLLQRDHFLLKHFWLVIAVEGNDVRQFDLNLRSWPQLSRKRPVAFPNSTRQWLRRMRGSRPHKSSRKQREHQLILVLRLQIRVAPSVPVVRLIPDVPSQDPGTE